LPGRNAGANDNLKEASMVTFLMMGKYSDESLRDASTDRTNRVVQLLEANGGKVKSIFALLGHYDIALMAQFDTVENAMKASVSLNKFTGIAFETMPAVSVDDFDKMLAE